MGRVTQLEFKCKQGHSLLHTLLWPWLYCKWGWCSTLRPSQALKGLDGSLSAHNPLSCPRAAPLGKTGPQAHP